MIYSLGIFSLLTMVGVAFAALAWAAEYQLASEEAQPESFRWLRRWSIQGLLTPWLLWALMNFGFSFEFQSFMPQLQKAQGTPAWGPLYAGYVAGGFCVISTYWTALTLGWIAWRASRGLQGELRKDFRDLCRFSLAGMALPAAGLLWLGGGLAVGLAATTLLGLIAGYAPVMLRPKRLPPLYARAIARIKFGKYSEAETEVIRQLEKREDDFDGWMILADLYANQFGNLDEAEQTILEICDQPRTNPSQLSLALNRLADWHLKLPGDPDAARRALGVIVNRLPGSHLARMAQTRAAQLPHTAEEWREQQANKPVPLPALHDPLGESAAAPTSPAALRTATARAAQLNARLKERPDDGASREELARLLAGPLNQPQGAITHIEKLLAQANPPPAKIPDWLGLIAVWQLEQLHDLAAGRATLERLIHEYPETSTAFAAQRRLQHLDTDEKLRLAEANKPPPRRIRVDTGGKSA